MAVDRRVVTRGGDPKAVPRGRNDRRNPNLKSNGPRRLLANEIMGHRPEPTPVEDTVESWADYEGR